MKNRFELEETRCPLCQHNKKKTIFVGRDRQCKKKGEFRVVECETCGLLYTDPRPSQETIGYFYPLDYGPYEGFFIPQVEVFNRRKGLPASMKNELKYRILKNYYSYQALQPVTRFPGFDKLPAGMRRAVLKIFQYYFRKRYYRIPVWRESGRALDIGCGSGAYLLLLKNIGWNVVGADISDNVASEVREAGIPILTGELEKLGLEPCSFDLITMWHTLEHLPSPIESLQEIHRLLKNNGSLLIEVPNSVSIVAKVFGSNWFAWDLPRHLYHFSPVSLSRMLTRAGFRVVSIRHLSKNNLPKSIAYWLEGMENNFGIDQLEKSRFFCYLLKYCGTLLSLLHSSDMIFATARKD